MTDSTVERCGADSPVGFDRSKVTQADRSKRPLPETTSALDLERVRDGFCGRPAEYSLVVDGRELARLCEFHVKQATKHVTTGVKGVETRGIAR